MGDRYEVFRAGKKQLQALALVTTWKLRPPCSRSALNKVVPLAPLANLAPSLRADGEMLNVEVSDIATQSAVWPEGYCFT